MPNVYDQHHAAFACVEAYVVLNSARERVATVAFKRPRDGAGRLYCYLHVLGTRMVRGFAAGGGYDKRSAAAQVASRRLEETGLADYPDTLATVKAFKAALQDGPYGWQRELENAGFTVLRAV